jgi:hypothetical protein
LKTPSGSIGGGLGSGAVEDEQANPMVLGKVRTPLQFGDYDWARWLTQMLTNNDLRVRVATPTVLLRNEKPLAAVARGEGSCEEGEWHDEDREEDDEDDEWWPAWGGNARSSAAGPCPGSPESVAVSTMRLAPVHVEAQQRNCRLRVRVHRSSSSRSGGHDDVETLATAANRVTAFAEAIWAQAQEFPRRKIVFLGPNPPVNTPRHQPPTVAWQDPTPHRLALTAAFSHFLRSNAERRGFKYATILEDVLDSAINQPKVRETKSDTPRMHTYMCLFICLNCGLRFLDHSFSPTCFLLTSNQTLPDLYLGEVLVYRERFRPAFERAVHCTLMAACFETAGWH